MFSWDSFLTDVSSGFAKYVKEGEWVGDVAAGVGTGILAYQQSKDAEKAEARQNAWQNERYYAKSAPLDNKKYGSHVQLAGNGVLTNGLLAQAK